MAHNRREFDRTVKYGSLTWVRDVHDYFDKHGNKMCASEWKCDCGKTVVRPNTSVVSGNTKSCGCRSKRHNMSNHPLYMVWINIKRRCYNPKAKGYAYYGGRGIKVCEEWLDSKAFLDWAVSNGYKNGLSIDRIDVNGDYCPSNCRWTDSKTQANNKRSNRPITINGVTKNAKQWADDAGLRWSTFQRRVDVYGMSAAEAITRQVRPHTTKNAGGVEIDGVTKTISEWSRITGVPPDCISRRINKGWNPKKAVFTKSLRPGSWVKKPINPGTRVGCLTIVSEVEPTISSNGKSRSRYRCVCDCGREKLVLQQNLLGKNPTISCGKHKCRRLAKELMLEKGHA